MTMLKLSCAVGAMQMALLNATPHCAAQSVEDFYRITGSASRNHLAYQELAVPRGKETMLADLKGPGKVTYFYITDDTQVH
jgi:hypothetical protein